MIDDEQGGFRKGRGCVDQIFAIRQLIEKCVRKGKSLYAAFMDLEKAYDRIDRDGLWRVLDMYGVNGKLLNGIKSFYFGSKACLRVNGTISEWFDVKVGLRQGCVMSTWLFNIYMDGVMKEVRELIGNVGVELKMRNKKWKVSHLLYADDAVLFAESEKELQESVNSFVDVCKRRKLGKCRKE